MNVAAVLRIKGNQLVTARREIRIEAVMHQMTLERVGAVVVTSPGNDRIVGMISERDIVRGLVEYGAAALMMRISDLMTHSIKTCNPQDSLKQVMAVMTCGRIRHLPVVDERGLCGIVSIGDIVKHRLGEMELEVNVLRDACLAGRLAVAS